MDYKAFIESIPVVGSIYSFRRNPDGSFGEICMMAHNELFNTMGGQLTEAPEFYPGIPYTAYFKDVNFERNVYKCGTEHKEYQAYIPTHGFWLNCLFIPLVSDEEDVFYVCYLNSFHKEIDTQQFSRMTVPNSTDVFETLIKLHQDNNFYRAITDAVANINRICASRTCCIWIWDKNDRSCSMISTNGVDNDYGHQIASGMNRTMHETSLIWEEVLKESDCVICEDDRSMEVIRDRDERWYDSLASHGVSSIVFYGLKFRGELVGFLWATNFNTENTDNIKSILESVSFFLASVIANHQMMKRLEVLSTVDTLTEVKNRNAMNKRVDTIASEEAEMPSSIGVVFVDINGLKKVNDTEGHDAGDRLIRRTATVLRAVFSDYEVYRAGGDEFMVLCPGVTEEALANQVSELERMTATTDDISLAVGTTFASSNYSIFDLMQAADERMYKNKSDYYELHPERKWRG